MIGTFINTIAILAGSSLGLALHNKFPEKIKSIVFQGIGLFDIVLGVQMALQAINPLITIFSLLVGGIIGQLANLDVKLENLSEGLKRITKSKSNTFTIGLMTASLLFCVGPMAILGSINDGLQGDYALLLTKSVLDGISSIALASSLGVGVVFSSVAVLLYQGTITLFAGMAQDLFTTTVIKELTGVGGILILGLGFNLLEIKRINVTNLLPSLLVVIVLTAIL